mgnify:CR=1 FL=1
MQITRAICEQPTLGVVPVLIGPIQVLLTLLPAILLSLLAILVSLFKPRVLKTIVLLLWRQKVAVAMLALCILLLANLLGGAGPDSSIARAETDGRDWPAFRGGLARRGAVSDANEPMTAEPVWTWKQDREAFFSSPAIVGNRVYVASATMKVFNQSGSIYCFDADTGAVVWRAAPKGYRPTFSSPVISGRYLVCGEGLHLTDDARIICLDLRPGRQGQVLWVHRTASHVECTPVIYEGRVYVGAGDDGYYCLQLEPDENRRAKVLWHVEGGPQYQDAETSLAVYDGKVFAGLGQGGRAICVLDAETGEETARLNTPYPVFGPPAIVDGRLYVGMGNGNYVNTAEEVRQVEIARMQKAGAEKTELEAANSQLKPAGEVWCLDVDTLDVMWRFATDRTVLGAVAVAEDDLYFGTRGGTLYCLNRAGQLVAKRDMHGPIIGSVAISGQLVYVMTNHGTLCALRRRLLEPVWETTVSTQPMCISSPAVARGHVYVGTEHDGFACIGGRGDVAAHRLWQGYLGKPGSGGKADTAPLPEFGAYQWSYPADQQGRDRDVLVTAPAASVDGRLLIPLSGPARSGLACLRGGEAETASPEQQWFYDTNNGVHVSPALIDDRVFVCDGRPGGKNRNLHCINLSNGAAFWKRPLAEGASGVLAVTPRLAFVQDDLRRLTAYDLAGKRLWSRQIGPMLRAPTIAGAIAIAVAVDPPEMTALDARTGGYLWSVPIASMPQTSIVCLGTSLFLATRAGVEAFHLTDGRKLAGWNVEGGGATGDFALAEKRLAYVNAGAELVLISRSDGSVLRKIPGARRGSTPFFDRGTVFWQSAEGVMKMDLPPTETAEPVVWTDTSWLGDMTTPMIAVGSRIYMGRSGWGLVCLGEAQ